MTVHSRNPVSSPYKRKPPPQLLATPLPSPPSSGPPRATTPSSFPLHRPNLTGVRRHESPSLPSITKTIVTLQLLLTEMIKFNIAKLGVNKNFNCLVVFAIACDMQLCYG